MEKNLTIVARKVNTKDGKSFVKFSTQINDIWYRVSFNRSVDRIPNQPGRYHFTVDTKALSVARGKKYISKDGIEKYENDTLWISEYVSAKKFTDEELRKEQESQIAAVFGDESDNLPF